MSDDRPGKLASEKGSWRLLCAILVVAAGLRLYGLDAVPPSLSHDEASNAYDGYCLLKTGQDRWGERWPVVLRAFGDADYRPAMMAYLTVPFQALLGPMRVVTAARLPTALWGVATVLVLYLLGRRLFSERVGLCAALLLALCPWHILVSRLAHESGLTPMFPVLILWLLTAAGLRLDGQATSSSQPRLRWRWMAAAGAAIGLAPYSYGSTKLFVPALLAVVGLVYWRTWIRELGCKSGRRALAAMLVTAAVVAGPMFWVHLTDWNRINARALSESLLHRDILWASALSTIGSQYLDHFGLDWLFVTGDRWVDQSPPGVGQFQWYLLPLLMVGLVWLVRHWREPTAKLVLAWLLLYPIASASTHGGVSTARAAVGLCVFPLIGGLGLSAVLGRFEFGSKRLVTLWVSLLVIVGFAARFAVIYFVRYGADPQVQALYQVEFRQAMDYLRSEMDRYDHVFVTDRRSAKDLWHTGEAYIFPLVYLPIEPDAFHAMIQRQEVIEINPSERVGFHRIARAGNFTFAIDADAMGQYRAAFPSGKILLIARPGEVVGGRVVYRIQRVGAGRDQPGPSCLELWAVDLARNPLVLPKTPTP